MRREKRTIPDTGTKKEEGEEKEKEMTEKRKPAMCSVPRQTSVRNGIKKKKDEGELETNIQTLIFVLQFEMVI